jgi:hypothetical protein
VNIYYNSTDRAGNTEVTNVSTIKIDKTPPMIAGAVTTQPNAYGWYNTSVTAHFDASDSIAGIDYITPDLTLITEGADQYFVGMARDNAGNVAYYEIRGINIDKTPPSMSGAATICSCRWGFTSRSLSLPQRHRVTEFFKGFSSGGYLYNTGLSLTVHY